MGCSASSEEVHNLRSTVSTLKATNEQLSTHETALTEELNKVIRIAQTDKEKAMEALSLLSTLLGASEPVSQETRIPSDMENIKDYFNNRLAETESQQDMCNQILSIVNHYKSIISQQVSENQQEFHSLSQTNQELLQGAAHQNYQFSTLKETFETLIQVKNAEKDIALAREKEQITCLEENVKKQESTIKFQETHLRKFLIKQLCKAMENLPTEHQRLAFHMWRIFEPKTPEKVQERPMEEVKIEPAIKSFELNPKNIISPLNVFKFLEELFDKKYELDQIDVSEGRKPKAMSEFLVAHVNRSFGVEKVAINYLSKLIPTLEHMLQRQHPYAKWFCQSLHLFNTDAFPLPLMVYITKVRMEFHSLIDKYDKASLAKNPKHVGYKSKVKNKLAHSIAEQGGFAFLNDAIDLITGLFGCDKNLGINLIDSLKPNGLSDYKYTVYRICNKIKKQGTTPEGLYYMLDKDGTGKVSVNEIIQGMKALDSWISDSHLESFFTKLDKARKGFIPKAKFLTKINMNIIQSLNQSTMLSKSEFLIQLCELYMNLYHSDVESLTNMFPEETISFEDLRRVAREFTQEITESGFDKLYHDLEKTSPNLDRQEAAKIMLEYAVGAKSTAEFANHELQNALIAGLNTPEIQKRTSTG